MQAPTVSANPAPGGTLVLGGFDKTQFLGDVYWLFCLSLAHELLAVPTCLLS